MDDYSLTLLVDSINSRMDDGFENLHKRMDTGKDANIKAQETILQAAKEHDNNDAERHKDVLKLLDKQDDRVTSLETTRTEYETFRKIALWLIGIVFAIAALPWVVQAMAQGK